MTFHWSFLLSGSFLGHGCVRCYRSLPTFVQTAFSSFRSVLGTWTEAHGHHQPSCARKGVPSPLIRPWERLRPQTDHPHFHAVFTAIILGLTPLENSIGGEGVRKVEAGLCFPWTGKASPLPLEGCTDRGPDSWSIRELCLALGALQDLNYGAYLGPAHRQPLRT